MDAITPRQAGKLQKPPGRASHDAGQFLFRQLGQQFPDDADHPVVARIFRDPGKIGAPHEATGSKPLNPRSGSMQAFVPLRQVPVGPLLVAEGVLAGQEHVRVSVLVQPHGRVPGQRGELGDLDTWPALLVGAGAARPRAGQHVVEDHANVGKRIDQEGNRVGVDCTRAEPENVVLPGCVFPDRVGGKGADVHRRQWIRRPPQ